MLSATTYFCDAYASWQRAHPTLAAARANLDALDEPNIQEIAMTINLTTREYFGFRSPVEASLSELSEDVGIRFA